MNTASEQFVQDYLLVMDNDEDAWRDLNTTARDSANIGEFVGTLRSEWDDYVNQVALLADREWGQNSPASLLVRQIMGGWGDSEFFAIAKTYYKEEASA